MRSRSLNDWTTYKQFRNQCTGLYRKAKDDYFARMISKLKGFDDGSHHWWRLAKDIAQLSRCKDQIPDLEDNGTSVTTDEDRAELLAKYFASVVDPTITLTLTGMVLPSRCLSSIPSLNFIQ